MGATSLAGRPAAGGATRWGRGRPSGGGADRVHGAGGGVAAGGAGGGGFAAVGTGTVVHGDVSASVGSSDGRGPRRRRRSRSVVRPLPGGQRGGWPVRWSCPTQD